MKNETQEDNVFGSENCRAKARGTDTLIECLAVRQAGFCKFSLHFGNVYFCSHPDRDKIVAHTEEPKNDLGPGGIEAND